MATEEKAGGRLAKPPFVWGTPKKRTVQTRQRPWICFGVRRHFPNEMAYERFLDRLPELPREWADSCTSDDHVLNLTAEEMCLMIEELNEVVRRWQIKAGMHGDDELGVEPVALILQAFRWFS